MCTGTALVKEKCDDSLGFVLKSNMFDPVLNTDLKWRELEGNQQTLQMWQ